MQETRFNNGRDSFAYIERSDGTHAIMLTKNITTSHYVAETLDITGVTTDSKLLHIEEEDGGTVLNFACANGGEFRIVLRSVAPEALCDAVEAARLQEVDA